MNNIRLLDCTLRDGGHVNGGRFGFDVIKSIIEKLVEAKIDIIELGFLSETRTDDDVSRFSSVDDVRKYLPDDLGTSKLAIMADYIDVDDLESYDGTIEYIRLSFRKEQFNWAEHSAAVLKDKGYKIFINPIHGSSISDEEYIEIVRRVNDIEPYGFSIVDTFGAMRQKDLARIYYLLENNLKKDIVIGVHLHENLGIAYSLAQYLMGIAIPTRNIVIDGSLYGMGKIPGNLCVEQIMDFMNCQYGTNYDTEPVYDAIDEFIAPIKEAIPWGYSIPYAISGQCSVHRTYAEYLSRKQRLRSKDIRRIMNLITEEHKDVFDQQYVENLYMRYINVEYDDSKDLKLLGEELRKYSRVIILAPGASLNQLDVSRISQEGDCVISVNFVFSMIKSDFLFYTNTRRLGYSHNLDNATLIITSNLKDELNGAGYVVARNRLSYHNDLYCDDSTIMLLTLLKRIGKKEVFVAGFDGFKEGERNFYIEQFERKLNENESDRAIRGKILRGSLGNMTIRFLTSSVYEQFCIKEGK